MVNNIKTNNAVNYLNNGRTTQNTPIHSTKLKNITHNFENKNNGKIFTKEISEKLQSKHILISNDKKEKNNFISWILNTINPINHIPVLSTVNNLVNKTSKSLDMVQSAIGGAIYGGGPIGLAKGLGGWLVNKLIPKNLIANNPQKIIKQKEVKSKPENLILMNSNKKVEKKVEYDFLPSSKIELEKKSSTKENDLANVKRNYESIINFYIDKKDFHTKKIDIDA